MSGGPGHTAAAVGRGEKNLGAAGAARGGAGAGGAGLRPVRRVGCDLLRSERLSALAARDDCAEDPFVRSCFSPEERRELAGLAGPAARGHFLATGFALKEAAYKCLRLDDDGVAALEARLGRRVTLADLRVVRTRDWPELLVASALAGALGVSACDVSLSHDEGLVVAVAQMELVGNERPGD